MHPLVKFTMYAQHEQIHVAGWPALAADAESVLPQLSGGACLALSRSYALEGSVFVIVPNQLLPLDPASASADGLSAVIYGPDGSVLSEPIGHRTEGVVFADLDLAAVSFAKAFADPVGHYSRPDVFTFAADLSPRRPAHLDGAVPPAETALALEDVTVGLAID